MLTVLLRSELLFPEDSGLLMPRCFWNGCDLWVKKAVISFPILLKLWKAMGTSKMPYSSWMPLYQFGVLQIDYNIYFLYSKTSSAWFTYFLIFIIIDVAVLKKVWRRNFHFWEKNEFFSTLVYINNKEVGIFLSFLGT